MIPKIIHYCWFGRNPKPKQVQKCIESWKKYCPEYKLIEWTEDNFDLEHAPRYVQDAYREKKWAFIADYARLAALSEMGGIYFDTDVELIDSMDQFLNCDGFTGTEDGCHVSAGVMGCVKGNPVINQFKETYNDISFYKPDGSLNMTTIVVMMTDFFENKGYVHEDVTQVIDGFTIYASPYFYPLSVVDGVMRKTKATVAIHWFAGSWETEEKKKERKKNQRKRRIRDRIVALIGENRYEDLKKILHYKSDV